MADDGEVWKRICRGDAAAFEAFYRENAPRLQAFLQHMVGSRQTAEDLTQETFAQIWNQPNGYRPERGALRGYLFGIGRKRAADWWRRERPSEPIGDERAGNGAEVQTLLVDALRRLPEQQRTLLWLREVEGLSYAELAAILEIPVGTVRSRLFAAREGLRAMWRGAGQES